MRSYHRRAAASGNRRIATGSFRTACVLSNQPTAAGLRVVFLKILQDQTLDEFFIATNQCGTKDRHVCTYIEPAIHNQQWSRRGVIAVTMRQSACTSRRKMYYGLAIAGKQGNNRVSYSWGNGGSDETIYRAFGLSSPTYRRTETR